MLCLCMVYDCFYFTLPPFVLWPGGRVATTIELSANTFVLFTFELRTNCVYTTLHTHRHNHSSHEWGMTQDVAKKRYAKDATSHCYVDQSMSGDNESCQLNGNALWIWIFCGSISNCQRGRPAQILINTNSNNSNVCGVVIHPVKCMSVRCVRVHCMSARQ